MIGILLLVCLISGPRTKWASKCLPNTLNRVVFSVFVSVCIVVWLVSGVSSISSGDTGAGWFTLATSALTAFALYRFIAFWRVSKQVTS
jgi:hypothetical protein